jgi:hypothetical protein
MTLFTFKLAFRGSLFLFYIFGELVRGGVLG